MNQHQTMIENLQANAGGIRVIRYGMTRVWVLGLTVVTVARGSER